MIRTKKREVNPNWLTENTWASKIDHTTKYKLLLLLDHGTCSFFCVQACFQFFRRISKKDREAIVHTTINVILITSLRDVNNSLKKKFPSSIFCKLNILVQHNFLSSNIC